MPDYYFNTASPAARIGFQMRTPDGVGLAPITVLRRAEYALNDVGEGAATLVFPLDYWNKKAIATDLQLYIQRISPAGKSYLEGDKLWLLRAWEFYADENSGDDMAQLEFVTCDEIVGRREIPYQSGNEYTYKLDQCDDMMKAIVRENLGTLATDANRNIANLSVEADRGLGPTRLLSFEKNKVSDALTDIAKASEQSGTWLGWRVVVKDWATGALEFRTYTGYTDVDKRGEYLIGKEYGNLFHPRIRFDYTGEWNYIYAGGSGDTLRPIAPAYDTAAINASPYNRRELFVDASSALDAAELQSAADSALKANRGKITLTGGIRGAALLDYGTKYRLGTLVTGKYGDYSDGFRVAQVHSTWEPNQAEQLDIALLNVVV